VKPRIFGLLRGSEQQMSTRPNLSLPILQLVKAVYQTERVGECENFSFYSGPTGLGVMCPADGDKCSPRCDIFPHSDSASELVRATSDGVMHRSWHTMAFAELHGESDRDSARSSDLKKFLHQACSPSARDSNCLGGCSCIAQISAWTATKATLRYTSSTL
jgi:hypothetical protein